MYYETEIEMPKEWAHWLSTFREEEEREADINDRSKIAISISNVFHKNKRAKFKTFNKEGDKTVFIVKRLKTPIEWKQK